jgi:hypothetical protein
MPFYAILQPMQALIEQSPLLSAPELLAIHYKVDAIRTQMKIPADRDWTQQPPRTNYEYYLRDVGALLSHQLAYQQLVEQLLRRALLQSEQKESPVEPGSLSRLESTRARGLAQGRGEAAAQLRSILITLGLPVI